MRHPPIPWCLGEVSPYLRERHVIINPYDATKIGQDSTPHGEAGEKSQNDFLQTWAKSPPSPGFQIFDALPHRHSRTRNSVSLYQAARLGRSLSGSFSILTV